MPMLPLPIIFEDSHLLVVNKPNGLLVVPTPKNEKHTLTNLINKMLGNLTPRQKAYPCHRLDREASGLIIYAKDVNTLKKMEIQFKNHQVKKKYIAFVRGWPRHEHGSLTYRIEGQPAVTHYRILQKLNGFSVAEAEPVTGRTNQIRIHFAKLEHPVLGERKFAFGKDFPVKLSRLALHASALNFTHPVTGKKIDLSIALPENMSLDKIKSVSY
ncbi:MAG: RluA family pseudouridine synthase [Planctomycetota bacterium]